MPPIIWRAKGVGTRSGKLTDQSFLVNKLGAIVEQTNFVQAKHVQAAASISAAR